MRKKILQKIGLNWYSDVKKLGFFVEATTIELKIKPVKPLKNK